MYIYMYVYIYVVTKAASNFQRQTTITIVRKTQKMICFNPPFSQTVKTNVAKLFFRLLDKHFPKSHLLYKIFIRNTIKVSYSYMNNALQVIKQHNRKVSNKKNKPNKSMQL